jgi:hypothetical protein
MIIVWLLIGIAASIGDPTAATVWAWFGHHVFLAILEALASTLLQR